jgi:hypothetical protein
MYLHLPDVFSLLKDNLDYIVNAACADLRYDQLQMTSYNYRPALVVDAVFSAFGTTAFQLLDTSSSPTHSSFSLLRDMVLSTFDQVDQLAANNIIGSRDMRSLLRVMNVIVYRAVPPMQFIGCANDEITEGVQQIQTALLTGRGFNKLFLTSSPAASVPTLRQDTARVGNVASTTFDFKSQVEHAIDSFCYELDQLFPVDSVPKLESKMYFDSLIRYVFM